MLDHKKTMNKYQLGNQEAVLMAKLIARYEIHNYNLVEITKIEKQLARLRDRLYGKETGNEYEEYSDKQLSVGMDK